MAAPTLPSLMAKFLLMTVALGFRTPMRDVLFCLVWAFPFLLMIYLRKATPKVTTLPSLCGSIDHQEHRSRDERGRRHDRSGFWTFEENKRFENALATYTGESHSSASLNGFPEKVAPEFPGKSVGQVRRHLEALLHDLELIESGKIAFPEQWTGNDEGERELAGGGIDNGSSSSSFHKSKVQRGKGIWSKEEHKSFLRGLGIYGKGKWKQISVNVVFTKNPKQVARHAYNFFKRQDRPTNRKRRRIIYDDEP